MLGNLSRRSEFGAAVAQGCVGCHSERGIAAIRVFAGLAVEQEYAKRAHRPPPSFNYASLRFWHVPAGSQ